MRCIQSLKLSKWLCGIKFMGNELLYSDSRINMLKLEHFAPKVREKEVTLFQYYDKRDDALWIVSKRECRKVDVKNGRVGSIFVLCGED